MMKAGKHHKLQHSRHVSVSMSAIVTLLIIFPLLFLHVHDAQAFEVAKTTCEQRLSALENRADDYNSLLSDTAQNTATIDAAELADETVLTSLSEAMSDDPPQSVNCDTTNRDELEHRSQTLSGQIQWFDDHVEALGNAIDAVNNSRETKLASEAQREAAAKKALEASITPLEESDTSRPNLANYTDVSIQVDISAQRVYAQSAGTTIYTMVASTGAHDSTPRGDFVVEDRGLHFYNENEGMGADYWVRFRGEILFHSIPTGFDFGDYLLEEAAKLGQPASHGCVRLSVADATWFYEQLDEGTPVHVY